jgi:2-keto-4-pentenoate hydratase/2-oxohepta-3-ene-1,7-dioic acid hydratase in catechol pathway
MVERVPCRMLSGAQRGQRGEEACKMAILELIKNLPAGTAFLMCDLAFATGDWACGFLQAAAELQKLPEPPALYFIGQEYREHFHGIGRARVIRATMELFLAEKLKITGHEVVPLLQTTAPDLATEVIYDI